MYVWTPTLTNVNKSIEDGGIAAVDGVDQGLSEEQVKVKSRASEN